MLEPPKPAVPHDRETPPGAPETPGTSPFTPLPGSAHPDAPAESMALPAFVGRYRIEEEIGRGGMGVVYRGHDPHLNRGLAVKILLEEHQNNSELQKRFLEEAQVMGQLQHPGVAPVHELGTLDGGRPFFSMKQIRGRTLADLIKDGQQETPPPAAGLPRLLHHFAQVCQTMAFAHARGILHRDLKPSNVMVGTFGEVQVMDWGLAKVLGAGGGAPLPAPGTPSSSTIFTVRTGLPDSDQTAAGTVLGTPAYMAPEQARGEVELLDERCDVFGLGGILCEILTGRPPFAGESKIDSHRRAMKGDLASAFARLDSCGAELEVVNLARRCLAAEKVDRPRHAGAVAEAVDAYHTGVQERLRQAEIARAAAQVKVAEERKRRRLSVALASLAALLILAAGGAGMWYHQEQVARDLHKDQLERNLEAQLDEADREQKDLHGKLADPRLASQLLSDIGAWKAQVGSIRGAWNRAQLIYKGNRGLLGETWEARLAERDEAYGADEQAWNRARKLDDIRVEAASLDEGKWNPGRAADRYEPAFMEMGLDVTKGEPAAVAVLIRQSPIRQAVVAALDHWATVLPAKSALVPRLMEIAKGADPDAWRDQVRDVKVWADRDRLLKLAQQVPPEQTTPQMTLLLVWRVKQFDNKSAAALVRQALLANPRDFWLHFDLGNLARNPADRAGCYRAALALRPGNVAALNNLGNALLDQNDLGGALKHYQKAIDLDPKHIYPHSNRAIVLRLKKDPQGAVAACNKALEIDPTYVSAYINLGYALRDMSKLSEAMAAFNKAADLSDKAIQRDPSAAWAHNAKGVALLDMRLSLAALVCFHKAVALDPNNVTMHNNLALAQRRLRRWSDANASYKKAIEIDPTSALTHRNLGDALREQKDLTGAIAAYNKAIALDPEGGWAYHSLGETLREQKDLTGAIAFYNKAAALDPERAMFHHGLGDALRENKELAGAITAYKKAVQVDPYHVQAHISLGQALHETKQFDEGVGYLQRATELDSSSGLAHCHLGRVLQEQGKFAAALKSLRKGHELGSARIGWDQPSALWLRQCEQLMLDNALPAILRGEAREHDTETLLTLAVLCKVHRKPALASARCYEAAFAAGPKSLAYPTSYNAACQAALAAGQGKEPDPLDEKAKGKLRQQALSWLQASLGEFDRQLQGDPRRRWAVQFNLLQWQQDGNLASLREAGSLARLEERERRQCQQFWANVQELIDKARKAR